MIICPNCAAENRSEAQACYFCGQPFDAPPSNEQPPASNPQPTAPGERANPTQPVRVDRSRSQPTPPTPEELESAAQTQPGAQAYPPGATIPGPGAYPGYAQSSGQHPGSTQPYPTYDPNAPGYDPAGYNPAGYNPADSQPAPAKSTLERFLPWLIGVLVVVFLCAAGMMVWTFTALLGGGSTRLGQQVATQAAEVLPSTATEAADGVSAAEPTPWPTFTPLPTFTSVPTETPTAVPQPSATPEPAATQAPPSGGSAPGGETGGESETDIQPTLDPTQAVDLEKLLSPECAAALDSLNELGSQVTANPTAPLSADWRAGLNQTLEQVNTHCGTLEEASPLPGIVNEARSELNLATTAFDEAARLFNEGLREWNLGKVLEAGTQLRQASDHLNKALTALGKIQQ